MVEAAHSFKCAGQSLPFFRRLDVLITVVIEGAIAIEYDKFHGILSS
jgi:hypothetical protein